MKRKRDPDYDSDSEDQTTPAPQTPSVPVTAPVEKKPRRSMLLLDLHFYISEQGRNAHKRARKIAKQRKRERERNPNVQYYLLKSVLSECSAPSTCS